MRALSHSPLPQISLRPSVSIPFYRSIYLFAYRVRDVPSDVRPVSHGAQRNPIPYTGCLTDRCRKSPSPQDGRFAPDNRRRSDLRRFCRLGRKTRSYSFHKTIRMELMRKQTKKIILNSYLCMSFIRLFSSTFQYWQADNVMQGDSGLNVW